MGPSSNDTTIVLPQISLQTSMSMSNFLRKDGGEDLRQQNL